MQFTTIGAIAKVRGGKRLRKGRAVQGEQTDHPYIRVVDFREDGFDPTNVKFISEEAYREVARYTISSDDIYISIAGTIGRVGIVPREYSGANLTENSAKISITSKDFNKWFVMYYLRSQWGKAEIASKIVGTSQQKLALFRIGEIKLPRFPLISQRRIASALSSYADLIENNLRRIKILEEMPQFLYREWFVNFRFPGHRQVRRVDSPLGKIPENWAIKKLGDAIELLYGKALREEDRKEGDIKVIGSSGVVGRHNEVLAKGPGIVVGRKGNVGSVHWIDTDFWPIDTVFYVSTDLPLPYAFFNLRSQGFINSDSAVPGLNRNQAYSLPFLCPQESIVNDFAKIVTGYFALISNFKAQNENLRQSRDLLLPKLISGQLDVTDLDIKISKDLE
jgi:type I restriction enzyme S subunit